MNPTQLRALMEDERHMRKTIALSDGRKLSFSECGDLDSGYPVLFHVGLMASSLGVVLFHQEALRLKFRIIAVDYPGVGDSTKQPDRTLRHWPSDLLEFCNQILGEKTKFALLAHSMGGPHALAVMADARLSSRILRATIVSPWLPFDSPDTSRLLKIARRMPSFLQESVIPTLATTLTTSTLSMGGSISSSSASDTNLNMIAAQRIVKYSRKQGQAGNREMVRIAIGEALVLPERITYPLHVFCGTKDNIVSEKACHKLIDLVRAAETDGGVSVAAYEYISVPNADHNSVMGGENISAILLTLQDI